VNFGVWVGFGGCYSNVPVNLLTSCMLRELRGLGGVGGLLTSLWTCSRHVCFVNFGVWVGWGVHVNVPVNLHTSCMLRELRGLGGVGGMLASLRTCSRHVCFVNFGVWVGWGGMLTSLWTCSRHVCFANFGVALALCIFLYTQYYTMKFAFRQSPLQFPLKNGTTRVVAKNVFLLKQAVNPHGEPGLPIFCKGVLGQDFSERAFWGAIDKLFEFLQLAKTAVVRRPSFVSQMSQTTYNIDNTFQLIFQPGHSSGTPDYCTFMSVWKQSVWTSYGVNPLGMFPS